MCVCLQNCELHAMAHDSYISGSLTAQKISSPNENTRFAFIDCKITGTGQVYLGRAWGPYSRTVYINTYMDSIIILERTDVWRVSKQMILSKLVQNIVRSCKVIGFLHSHCGEFRVGTVDIFLAKKKQCRMRLIR